MLDKLSNFFYSKLSRKFLLLFVGLFVVFNAFVLPHHLAKMKELAGKNLRPFDLTFGYDTSFAHHFLYQLGEAGRMEYLKFLLIYDFIYPFIYGGVLIAIISLLMKKRNIPSLHRFHRFNLLPLFIILFDFLENMCSVYTTLNFPNISSKVVFFGSVYTQIKWILVVLSILIVIYLGFKVKTGNIEST